MQLSAIFLIAAVAMTMTPSAPRIELTRIEVPNQPASAATAQRIAEIRLTLINDGTQPVEARTHMGIVPRIIDADGKPVALSDWRNLAGYAPPAPPLPPEDPVRTGERRLLESYQVMRTEKGYQFQGPYGAALLAAGHYRIEVALDLAPTTREIWVAAHAAAVHPGRRAKDPQAEAQRAATQFAAHWREVSGFFRGHLAAPPFVLVLP